jgi:DNA-binding NarL/FixJ family response regulator
VGNYTALFFLWEASLQSVGQLGLEAGARGLYYVLFLLGCRLLVKSMRILVIDDCASLRTAIVGLLASRIDSAEVGEAADGPSALVQFRRAAWDVLILDISIPGESGLTVLDKIQALRPGQPVVMFTTHLSQVMVNNVFSRGALGYVVKEDAPDELVPAIHNALVGQRYQSRRVISFMEGN